MKLATAEENLAPSKGGDDDAPPGAKAPSVAFASLLSQALKLIGVWLARHAILLLDVPEQAFLLRGAKATESTPPRVAAVGQRRTCGQAEVGSMLTAIGGQVEGGQDEIACMRTRAKSMPTSAVVIRGIAQGRYEGGRKRGREGRGSEGSRQSQRGSGRGTGGKGPCPCTWPRAPRAAPPPSPARARRTRL